MRNLARLRAAGIRAPAPLLLRMHVLVMEFIGEAGVAAPRLKVRARRGGKAHKPTLWNLLPAAGGPVARTSARA
jgi:RIO kinase 1